MKTLFMEQPSSLLPQ